MIAEVVIIPAYQFAVFLIYCIISASFSKLICLPGFYFSVIGIRLCTLTAECFQTHSLTFFNTFKVQKICILIKETGISIVVFSHLEL